MIMRRVREKSKMIKKKVKDEDIGNKMIMGRE